jgi:uncharacterized membrane protein YqgA involved in biofilm formation
MWGRYPSHSCFLSEHAPQRRHCPLGTTIGLLVQGGIAAGAFLLRDVMGRRHILAITAAGGLILLGVGVQLLEIKAVRVANFLVLAPLIVRFAEFVRAALGAT